MKARLLDAEFAEANPLAAQVFALLQTLKPVNPLADATPAPPYGVASRGGSEL
jgi:hypothetical protein